VAVTVLVMLPETPRAVTIAVPSAPLTAVAS
jgi:hypothetical protein